MSKRFRHGLMAAAIVSLLAGNASAAGLQLQNQTGSGNGNAFAGAAATAEDAGTIFFNPAGMTMLPEGHSFAVAGTILNRSVKFTDTGTTNSPLTRPTESNGADAGGTSLIPAFFWSYAVDPKLRLGLGVSPTFGNKTDYGFDFIGRNSGYYAKIEQFNVNPSIAFKANDAVSIGFGLNYATNTTRFLQGYPSGGASASAETKGEDSAFGYNLGLMFQAQPGTRVALTYRSELKFKLDGHLDIIPGAPTPNYYATANLTTPASASLAIAHSISDKTEILSDLTWTGWSVIQDINVLNKSTGALLNSLSYNFRDTMRFGLGANHQYNDVWKLRIGTAYDQTPVKSAADRTMTLPDSDRIWLAFGAKYKIDQNSSIDFGYAHIFFADATTARAVKNAAGTTVQTVNGKWTGNRAELLSVQWNYNFK